MKMSPSVGNSNPAIMFSVVVFPDPLGPSTVTKPDGIEVVLGGVALPVHAGTRLTGKVRSVIRGAGDTAIPPDGVVLSGHGAAAEYLRARSRALARLRRAGVQLVDAYPNHLPRLLVNKYLEMKRAGSL